MQEFLLKKYFPKRCLRIATYIFENTDLWLKLSLAFSPKRKSSLSSCLQFKRSNPLIFERQGVRYKMNPHDALQRRIYGGFYENYSLKLALSLIPPQGVFLDIGANVGFYTLNVAYALQGSGKIYSFEADPDIAKALKDNIALNPCCKNVEVTVAAVSDNLEPLTFYRSRGLCSGAGTLHKFGDFGSDHPICQVPSVTLDRFFAEKQISFVHLAKIDIEGAEPKLLKGAQETLQKQKIGHILIEFNGIRLAETGVYFEDIMRVFEKYNYECLSKDLVLAIRSKEVDPTKICDNLLFKAV